MCLLAHDGDRLPRWEAVDPLDAHLRALGLASNLIAHSFPESVLNTLVSDGGIIHQFEMEKLVVEKIFVQRGVPQPAKKPVDHVGRCRRIGIETVPTVLGKVPALGVEGFEHRLR